MARGSRGISPILGIAVTAGMLLAGTFAILRTRGRDPGNGSAGPTASAEHVLEGLLSGAPEPSSSATGMAGKRVPDGASLKEAIEFARPHMTNSVGRLDVGTALLALWASQHLEWDSLQSLVETSPALFRKDPEAERGKRLCASGVISGIRAEKTLARRLSEDRSEPLIERPTGAVPTSLSAPYASATAPLPELDLDPWLSEDWSVPGGGKLFFATLVVRPPGAATEQQARPSPSALKDQLVVEIIATKSSGTLVDGSEATACGILTGVTLPAAGAAPPSLGDTPQHRVVGLFDLPENRAHATARGTAG